MKNNSLLLGRLLFGDEGITTVAGRRFKPDEAYSSIHFLPLRSILDSMAGDERESGVCSPE
jgi:hypothetical protein